MAYKLRDYQQESLNKIKDFISSSKIQKGLIVAPTGAGKSLIVANIAREVNAPILCIQPSKELLQQNYEKYISYGLKASIYSASIGTKEISNVTFATPKSVFNKLNDFKRFEYICVDEAHLGSKRNSVLDKIVKQIKPKKVIGLTATPIYLANTLQGSMLKMMNRTKDSIFKHIIHVTQIQELTEKSFWSELVYENEYVDTSMLRMKSGASDFTRESISKMYAINNTDKNITNQIHKLKKEGRKSILVFVPSVQEARDLTARVDGSEYVCAETKKAERDKIITDFKSGKTRVVFNVNVLATGFDHPELDAIIMARPTASLAIYYQQVGRGCRIAPNKKNCKVIDLSGNAFRFGKVEDINFENIAGYGWGMFAGEKLVTRVLLSSSIEVTKDELSIGKISNPIHSQHRDNPSTIVTFGKHKGKTIQRVWEQEPRYLSWIASDKFEPTDEKIILFKSRVCEFIKAKLIY